MKLKYLVYMLSFLALMGMVSAGTYTEVNYNGMFKVAEIKSLDGRFVNDEKNEAPMPSSYQVESDFMMQPYAGYQTCYKGGMEGCLSCESTLLNDGYGQVTSYKNVNTVKSTCAKVNKVNGFSKSAFRDDFEEQDCLGEKKKNTKIETVTQFGACGNYY